MAGFTATAEIDVAAAPDRVWAALTEPEQIAAYMEGSRVETTWEVGSPITWDGEYQGREYQDKGEVLTYDEPHVLSVTHYSPMMGQPDLPRGLDPRALHVRRDLLGLGRVHTRSGAAATSVSAVAVNPAMPAHLLVSIEHLYDSLIQ